MGNYSGLIKANHDMLVEMLKSVLAEQKIKPINLNFTDIINESIREKADTLPQEQIDELVQAMETVEDYRPFLTEIISTVFQKAFGVSPNVVFNGAKNE